MGKEKTCFVISPIGNTGSKIRRRTDQILGYVIEPACANCRNKAVRTDRISEPDKVTSHGR